MGCFLKLHLKRGEFAFSVKLGLFKRIGLGMLNDCFESIVKKTILIDSFGL